MALSLFLFLRGRSGDRPAGRPDGGVPPPAAPGRTERESPAPAAPLPIGPAGSVLPARPRPGSLRGSVIFPRAVGRQRSFSYQIYIFGADGTSDGPRPVANSDRFELADLPAGRKAVLFFSPSGFLTCPYQIVEIPEGGEAEVILRPQACHVLEGKVVAADGTPVGGVFVTATEIVPLPLELYPGGKPAFIAGLESTLGSSGGTRPAGANPAEVPVGVFKVSPGDGLISRGAITDALGRFSVPLSTDEVPVPLSVSRLTGGVLKEEVVVPKAGFARLIVPIP
jgi:hypothetical protein